MQNLEPMDDPIIERAGDESIIDVEPIKEPDEDESRQDDNPNL